MKRTVLKRTVLCVEDNPVCIDLLQIILERMAYDVVIVEDGKKAVIVAGDILPDLIFMDFHLPGLDGVEAAKRIKSQAHLLHIPIIALTADIYARKAFMEAGVNMFVAKPIRSSSLERVISQLTYPDVQ